MDFKLFEAFKSDKLSKTLAFINKDSKGKFLEQLKTIANCRREDFVQILRLKLLRFKFADNDWINSDRSSKKYGNPGIEGDS